MADIMLRQQVGGGLELVKGRLEAVELVVELELGQLWGEPASHFGAMGFAAVGGPGEDSEVLGAGQLAMGGPEFSMQRVATAEMARYYNLPSRGGGMISDANAVDAQMGAEKMLNCLMPSLAGLNIANGIGMADSLNTVRPELMVIDNEIIRMVGHILKGFEVNQETIPLGLIGEVGPGGNYLTTEHTLKHFRRELWFTRLWDRKPWTVWEKEGAMEVAEQAWAMIKADKHVVPPLGLRR